MIAVMIAAMIGAAARTIVVADASKFGHNAFAHIVSLSRVHVLVTHARPAPSLGAALAEAGVEVRIVPDGSGARRRRNHSLMASRKALA